MQDFHSGHGRNFVGHENYFVVPKEIEKPVCEAVTKECPDVGVLSLHGKSLRLVRPCIRLDIGKDELLSLMFAAFKSAARRAAKREKGNS